MLPVPHTQASLLNSNSAASSSAFQVVLFYCLLIIFLPIATFFLTKYYLFDTILSLTAVQSNIYAAVSAVVALHVALALYLYRAYFEVDNGPTAAYKED